MSKLYNQQQTVFALCSIANTPSGRHGSVEQLQHYSKKIIQKVFKDTQVTGLIGHWKLVWGTQVYQVPGSTVADNAMFVAQNTESEHEFVIAISGTNPISAYGWVIEDAKLIPTVAWPYKSDNSNITGEIANGTSIGLNVLLNKLSDKGLTLNDFLRQQAASYAEKLSITVTGHSLGGALSPAVALALKDTKNNWAPHCSVNIAVQPSAGPTPGNDAWSEYYTDSLGDVTNRLWNKIDMVPHAWQSSMLAEIPTLYDPEIPGDRLIKKLVKLAELNSKLAGNMQQICPSSQPLAGTVNSEANITIQGFIIILETLIANNLIDKLDLTKVEIRLIKDLIGHWITYLNKQDDLSQSHRTPAIVSRLETDGKKALESLWPDFKNFIDFFKQVGYQHTTAYSILLNTSAFEARVTIIKDGIDF